MTQLPQPPRQRSQLVLCVPIVLRSWCQLDQSLRWLAAHPHTTQSTLCTPTPCTSTLCTSTRLHLYTLRHSTRFISASGLSTSWCTRFAEPAAFLFQCYVSSPRLAWTLVHPNILNYFSFELRFFRTAFLQTACLSSAVYHPMKFPFARLHIQTTG
jgi:hypothetical protein